MTKRWLSVPASLLGLVLSVLAVISTAGIAAGDNMDEKVRSVQKRFLERFDKTAITAVRPTPYGLFEVQLGMDIVYTDEQVSFVLDGTLIDAKTRRDITKERLDVLSQIPFDQLPLELAIKQVHGQGTRKVAIFEDPNCGYCKQLRQAINGIDNVTVYTFPYPILSEDSTQKVKDIWCSADPAAAWEEWMLKGLKPTKGKCKVPIDQMLALGKKLMIRGTPGILFADGGRVGGAIPMDEFEKRLK